MTYCGPSHTDPWLAELTAAVLSTGLRLRVRAVHQVVHTVIQEYEPFEEFEVTFCHDV